MRPAFAVLLGLASLSLTGCGPSGPRPLALGEEPCTHCHMTLADPRFAAEALTPHGKAMAFDDVGCLAAWLGENSGPVGSAWVMSFVDRTAWLRADSAVYLQVDSIRTPMASGLLALRPGAEADSVAHALGGRRLTWAEVLAAPHAHHAPSPS